MFPEQSIVFFCKTQTSVSFARLIFHECPDYWIGNVHCIFFCELRYMSTWQLEHHMFIDILDRPIL